MNRPVLIKLVIAIGVILGVAYWFSYRSDVDTLSVIETHKERIPVESPVSSNEQNLEQPTMQDRDIDAQTTHKDTESAPGARALYQFEDHGTAAYLDARDRVAELSKGFEVIQFEAIRINQSALMQVLTNKNQKPQLDREYSMPLLDGKSCSFAGRDYVELEPGKRFRVNGLCKGYGTFSGGYQVDNNDYRFLIRAHDQSATYVIRMVDNGLALLIRVAQPPQPNRHE